MVSSGGYECTFVEPPTSTLQTQCPICLQVLRDPYQATCCRSNFCHSCSQQLRTDRSCPTCRETNFSFVNNNNLKRFLNQLAVLCKHSDGCEWIGKLEDLEHHLNEVINSGESFHTVKTKLLFQQSTWLLQLCDYHSCANSKNLVLVKHFVGGK